jgi:hypothetical protein
VYRATYRRVLDRSERHYERYPEDRERVRRLLDRSASTASGLPGGDRLTPRRFRTDREHARHERRLEKLHYCWSGRSATTFLRDVEAEDSFSRNRIYALLHECGVLGRPGDAWSADRILLEQPEFEDEAVFFGRWSTRGISRTTAR